MADVNDRLFEVVKGQDVIVHSVSNELTVKTSLYLVFTAFMLSASIQIINFSHSITGHAHALRCAIVASSISACISLIVGIVLLAAALARDYFLFPMRQISDWIAALEKYRQENPDSQTEDPLKGITQSLIETAEKNKAVNERKAKQIALGSWLLFISIPFLAVALASVAYAFLN